MQGSAKFILLMVALWLSACSDPPSKSWNLTAQGAYSVAISSDGQYAVVGSILHGGSLWRLSDNERLYNWNHAAGEKSQIIATTFSKDNSRVLTAEKKRMVMWSVKTGKPLGFWQIDGGALSVALSNKGAFALVGQENYTAQYITTSDGQVLSTLAHSGDVNTVDISANGRIGITGAEDGYVKIWNLLDQSKPLHAYKLGDDIATVAISPDGKTAFGTLYYGKGKIWDVKTGKEISTIGYERNTISAARFSRRGDKLLTGDTSRHLILWEVKTGDKLQDWHVKPPTLSPPSGLVTEGVAFGKTENSIYAIFSNGTVHYWGPTEE